MIHDCIYINLKLVCTVIQISSQTSLSFNYLRSFGEEQKEEWRFIFLIFQKILMRQILSLIFTLQKPFWVFLLLLQLLFSASHGFSQVTSIKIVPQDESSVIAGSADKFCKVQKGGPLTSKELNEVRNMLASFFTFTLI
ncbi:uncharacterized protein LOC110685348 isoform X1 [Chenopodium quinoa]|uniref:uncharacterized protein LOC110685348 isoform X1 n=1 Tax=Chenopodium quinoa TaxID=63459 RepID=UPI000B76F5DE|nr:uncharacterized protein LOC110685348 isoform X1 [Chenopodium quinoa]